jgi:hypothetical protein
MRENNLGVSNRNYFSMYKVILSSMHTCINEKRRQNFTLKIEFLLLVVKYSKIQKFLYYID